MASQVFFDGGMRKALGQVDKFKERPEDLADLIVAIAVSPAPDRILKAGEDLVSSTREVLRRVQEPDPPETTAVAQFRQVYPEMKDMIDKLLSACVRGDPVAASLGAWYLQHDVTTMLSETALGPRHGGFNRCSEFASRYREVGFPDLMQFTSGPQDELAAQTRSLDERRRRYLREQFVDLCEFGSLEEFRDSL